MSFISNLKSILEQKIEMVEDAKYAKKLKTVTQKIEHFISDSDESKPFDIKMYIVSQKEISEKYGGNAFHTAIFTCEKSAKKYYISMIKEHLKWCCCEYENDIEYWNDALEEYTYYNSDYSASFKDDCEYGTYIILKYVTANTCRNRYDPLYSFDMTN